MIGGNRKDKVVVTSETDLEKFNRLLINVANVDVDIKHKILIVKKFIQAMEVKS